MAVCPLFPSVILPFINEKMTWSVHPSAVDSMCLMIFPFFVDYPKNKWRIQARFSLFEKHGGIFHDHILVLAIGLKAPREMGTLLPLTRHLVQYSPII